MSLGRTVREVREEACGLKEDVSIVSFQSWGDNVKKRLGAEFFEDRFYVFFRLGEVPSDMESLFL